MVSKRVGLTLMMMYIFQMTLWLICGKEGMRIFLYIIPPIVLMIGTGIYLRNIVKSILFLNRKGLYCLLSQTMIYSKNMRMNSKLSCLL
ncbi:hypothetical protein SY89_02252 [Halolamina pelagica]|uniref:Uncharacterized protein n=1 Tax=Halolamina pelagica TaxID=699431 RepID=A0A0P7I3G7_9EURY|nr:hypothetical protein SY89_02252 [Halolamina pelagica]